MGTTRPPFSQLIEQERRRWAPLRRALSNEDRAAFEAVAAGRIITDQASGQSKGFVEMPSASEAQAAITGLHGKELLGRTLNVNEARPRAGGSGPERRSGGGGSGPRGRPRG